MLVAVNARLVNAEERIGNIGSAGSVAQTGVDAPAPGADAVVGVGGPDDTVVVGVKVGGMLLEDLLMGCLASGV